MYRKTLARTSSCVLSGAGIEILWTNENGRLESLPFTDLNSILSRNYFAEIASRRALRRLLYRDAVFLWITPFCTDLSSAETVSR